LISIIDETKMKWVDKIISFTFSEVIFFNNFLLIAHVTVLK